MTEYPQCVDKSEAIYAHWERGDGDMGELAVGLRNLTAHYKALYEDYIKLKRLLFYANGILGHGSPGSAWIDWQMRCQGVLGQEFFDAAYKMGRSIPFDELRNAVEDLPRVLLRDLT